MNLAILLSLLFAVMGFVGCQPTPPRLKTMLIPTTQDSVKSVFEAVFNGADARDWRQCEAALADTVLFDYQSLTGQPPAKLPSKTVVANWKKLLPGFEGTQHHLSNYRFKTVGVQKIELQAYGQAFHYLPTKEGEPTWTVIGNYTAELHKVDAQWRITGLKFKLLFQSGNTNLPIMAADRVTTLPQLNE